MLSLLEAFIVREIYWSQAEVYKHSEPKYMYVRNQHLGGDEYIPKVEELHAAGLLDRTEGTSIDIYTVNERGVREMKIHFTPENIQAPVQSA